MEVIQWTKNTKKTRPSMSGHQSDNAYAEPVIFGVTYDDYIWPFRFSTFFSSLFPYHNISPSSSFLV
jgi:hypothetical protein